MVAGRCQRKNWFLHPRIIVRLREKVLKFTSKLLDSGQTAALLARINDVDMDETAWQMSSKQHHKMELSATHLINWSSCNRRPWRKLDLLPNTSPGLSADPYTEHSPTTVLFCLSTACSPLIRGNRVTDCPSTDSVETYQLPYTPQFHQCNIHAPTAGSFRHQEWTPLILLTSLTECLVEKPLPRL